MEYNNGVFLILESGYYRIVTHLRGQDHNCMYSLMKNARDSLIHTSYATWDATSTYYMGYLAMFDMISVELTGWATVGREYETNLVQIEKIY